MAVNNNIISVQSTTPLPIKIPLSLINNITFSQRKLIEILAAKPAGVLSSELTRELAISNKSYLVNAKFKDILTQAGLEISTRRVTREWLWILRSK